MPNLPKILISALKSRFPGFAIYALFQNGAGSHNKSIFPFALKIGTIVHKGRFCDLTEMLFFIFYYFSFYGKKLSARRQFFWKLASKIWKKLITQKQRLKSKKCFSQITHHMDRKFVLKNEPNRLTRWRVITRTV